MLYTEFLDGTGAREDGKTFEQYQTIEKIYSECEDMAKEDAYRIWKRTYGRQQKKDRARTLEMVDAMSRLRLKDGPLSPLEARAYRNIFQIMASIAEMNNFQAGFDAGLTTSDGVTYLLEKYGEVNFHRQMRLLIVYEGRTYGTAAVWSCGDARLHATPENLPKVT